MWKMKIKIYENDKVKCVRSTHYNYNFNKESGFFARWGETLEQNPAFGCVELADIEISTVCEGIGKTMESRSPCSWCYKSNTKVGKHMSLKTFKTIFHKFPRTLTQIAFGLGNLGEGGNPELWDILDYCKTNNYNRVAGNLTTNGMGVTKEIAESLAKKCGAVSVSRYHIPDVCYNAVEKITQAGLKQTNIHQLLARQTYESCFQLIDDAKNDPRLKDLNAIVFLSLKEKGDRNKFTSLNSVEDFTKLFKYAMDNKVSIGMDSCTQPITLKAIEKLNMPEVIPSTEGCEAFLYSIYCDVDGKVWPCSFMENHPGVKPVDMLKIKDFNEVWFAPQTVSWRENLINSSKGCNNCALKLECRSCPVFDITPCKENNSSLPIIQP